jgi:aldehyde:ferredoxin oxidoreductase
MVNRYSRQLLYIDLTSGEITSQPLDLTLVAKFIGGFGINARLAYELIPPGVDPLSPLNRIILGVGTLGGTLAPASCRVVATTKFPETGAIGSANGGGGFAPRLRYAGYDHVVISGRAPKPAYLYIHDGQAELGDATGLWGKDIYQTTDALWRRHGSHASIVAIGQAGENLVRISLALVDKQASLGKGGLAAVMGSKNLKAIVVSGSQGIAPAHPRRFMRLVNAYMERINAYPLRQKWVELGINMTWSQALETGFLSHNRTALFPRDKADQLYGIDIYLNKVKKGRMSCPSCPLADKEVFGVREGEFAGLVTYASGWYARNVNYGVLCQVGSYDKVVKCHDSANRYGIDAHSLCSLIDLVIYLYEQGVIGKADTDGVELKRDYETTQLLLRHLAFRQGLGDILAEGVRGLVAKFGAVVQREASQVKGLELVFDPRAGGLGTLEFEYLVNPRGGHHSSGGSPAYSPGQPLEKFRLHCERMGIPAEAIARILDSPFGFNVGRLTRYAEDWYAVLSSLGLCARGQMNRFYSLSGCAQLYSAVTGIELSPAELATAGERSWNVLKAANVREGFRREQDAYPPKWLEPVRTPGGSQLWLRDYYGTRVLTAEDLEKLLDDYYEERGWDRVRGIPTKEKLKELGLEDIIPDLFPAR